MQLLLVTMELLRLRGVALVSPFSSNQRCNCYLANPFGKDVRSTENHDYHSRERYIMHYYSLYHVRFTSVGLHACPAPPLTKLRNKGKCHYPSSVPIHP